MWCAHLGWCGGRAGWGKGWEGMGTDADADADAATGSGRATADSDREGDSDVVATRPATRSDQDALHTYVPRYGRRGGPMDLHGPRNFARRRASAATRKGGIMDAHRVPISSRLVSSRLVSPGLA